MFLYDIDKVNLLLEDGEKEIISYTIEPIDRKRYMFIFYEKGSCLYLKNSEYLPMELIEFMKGFAEKEMTLPDFLKKVAMQKTFIEAYKEKFLCTIKINEPYLIMMIEKAANLDINHLTAKSYGLNGFSMDCYAPRWGRILELGNYSKDKYFQPVIDLANWLLDMKGADPRYRFAILKKYL